MRYALVLVISCMPRFVSAVKARIVMLLAVDDVNLTLTTLSLLIVHFRDEDEALLIVKTSG